MDDIKVYTNSLSVSGIIDNYISLIWAKRYWDAGDCELCVPATTKNVAMLARNRYLKRDDDDMICRIVKVELKTSADEGNMLIVTGVDASKYLDQRIIWSTTTAQGNAENFVRRLVNDALITPLENERMLRKGTSQNQLMDLDTAAGFTEESTEQVSYKNLGEKVRDICRRYGWGYYVRLKKTGGVRKLAFGLYTGTDKSADVVFSPDFDNLLSSDYIEDASNIVNAALVGGSGEGATRACEPVGTAESVDRYEVWIDARNTSKEITYSELKSAYPLVADGGYGSIVGTATGHAYQMAQFDAQIYDDAQLLRLQNKYPGGMTIQSLSGARYYRVPNVIIAQLPSANPSDYDVVTLEYIAYSPRLCALGYENIAGHGMTTSFNGQIEPSTTFQYKTDYDLGDIVTIRNEYGMSVAARIVEIDEVNDADGYRIMPIFEYIA